MSSVVNNYLRWFELNRCKKAARTAGKHPKETNSWSQLFGFERRQDAEAGALVDGKGEPIAIDRACAEEELPKFAEFMDLGDGHPLGDQ